MASGARTRSRRGHGEETDEAELQARVMRLVNRGAPLRMVLPLITTSDLWEQLLNQDGDAPLLVGQRGWTLFRECILCGDQGLVFFPLKRYLQGRKLWFARQFVKERRRLSNRNAQRATRRAQRALRHQLQLDRRALLQHHAALQQELDTQRAIRQALGGLTERQSREQEEEEEEEGGATVSVPQLQATIGALRRELQEAHAIHEMLLAVLAEQFGDALL